MTAAIYIYLADVLSSFGALFSVIGLGGMIAFGVLTLAIGIDEGKYHGKNWAWKIPAVCLVFACLIPSSKTMYMMAGAVIGEQALESKVGQQLKEMLELKLNQQIEEMKKEVKK